MSVCMVVANNIDHGLCAKMTPSGSPGFLIVSCARRDEAIIRNASTSQSTPL